MAEPVDWPALMRLGLGVLRLPPDAFWSMTPGEFRRALEGAGVLPAGGQTMERDRLAELMAAFPDGESGRGHPGGQGPVGGAAAAGRKPAAAVRGFLGATRSGRAEGGQDEIR